MGSRLGTALALSILATMLGATPRAAAQAELTGTYVQYLGVGANGIMLNAALHSMAYSEAGAAPYSCDLYYPGSPVEEFTVEATGTTTFVASNTYSATAITTASGPTVSGRTITWSGTYGSGADAIRVNQVFSLETASRHVRLDVTITNTGTAALTNVYYLRNGDPDFGFCNIGTDFSTANDVVRQPPTDSSALVLMTAGATPALTLGMGSHDTRARAHAGGFNNVNASGTWTTPMDPAGALGDIGVALAFREASLAAGASTTFTMYYVWGPDAATVTSRFDAIRCAGCWDGTACQPGTSVTACGTGGVFCTSCVDGVQCTQDVCSAGLCANPPQPSGTTCSDGQYCTVSDACNGSGACTGSPRGCSDGLSCTTDTCNESADRCDSAISSGCLISGVCRSTGAANPSNACLVCDPMATRTAWSPASSGTTCSDGQYCTVSDACNGAGTCTGSARGCGDGLSCTSDICDEATDRCVSIVSGGCLIAGACVASGTVDPSNACRACDPSVSTTTWSARPSGTTCNDGQYCTVSDACNGAGSCTGSARDCSDGLGCTTDACDETGNVCTSMVSSGCLIAGACVSDGSANPSDACLGCYPTASRTAWSPSPTGTICGDPSCTDGSLTPAPLCDGAGSCDASAPVMCEGGTCADALTCNGTCADDASCPTTHYCDTVCVPDVPLGETCDRTTMCTSGSCVDGVCCEGDCGSPDAGVPDAGTPDGGPMIADAGTDAGVATDAGASDASMRDARVSDGSAPDADSELVAHGSSFLCSVRHDAPASPGLPLWIALAAVAVVLARRRR